MNNSTTEREVSTRYYTQDEIDRANQLRYVRGIALAPIGYVKHRHPIQRKRGVNSYTAEGRAMIHKQLEAVDMEILAGLGYVLLFYGA